MPEEINPTTGLTGSPLNENLRPAAPEQIDANLLESYYS